MSDKNPSSLYEIEAETIQHKNVSLEQFRNRVLLIVNTASKCGFTPQYQHLQKLYETYHSQGLEILGFPCNQFGGQEPGAEEEVAAFCQLNYGVSFPLFAKVEVNGDNTHPLFKYLKESLPGILGSKAIKWNFTKFLVDKEGRPIKRFAPNTLPNELTKDIEELLKN